MSTLLCVAVAVAAVTGAYLAIEPNPLLCAVVVVAAFVVRRPAGFVVGTFLIVSSLSAAAWAALDESVPAAVAGVASLSSDPERINGSVRAEVELNGRKYQAWATNETASQLARLDAGDAIYVEGPTRPLSGMATPSLRRKHVAARLQLEEVRETANAGGIYAVANGVRDIIERGSVSMDGETQALYKGLLLGDDREQSDEQVQNFRDSGLAHLLAVSGQNVAFLLLVLAPMLAVLGTRGRIVVAVAVLLVFGTITRWEPSVVRAVVMASVVLLARLSGRRVNAWRVLSLAVAASLVIDPFLVGSIGFLLSVGACCGMAALGERIARRVPGPRWLATAAGFTLAAELGVAPVQLAVFGPMPLVSLPCNLAAGPLAAFVMMWGMTAGLIAGVLGGPWAVLLSVPPALAVDALAWVAATGANHAGVTWTIGAVVAAAGLLIALPRQVVPEAPARR